MGLDIDREHFDAGDHARFERRLRDGLAALEALLARPGFGAGPGSVGAELELCLVGPDALPRLRNHEVLADVCDARVTVELDRFNLELNTRPVPLSGTPFTALRRELESGCTAIRAAAARHDARIVAVGILPTLRQDDLLPAAMSDLPRYRALSAALRDLRPGPFSVDIDGADPLALECDEITLEGANTALQVHLRVEPDAFAAAYNAAQAATAPVLALAGNSPLFLGHRLWEETRIVLFKQSVDARAEPAADWHPPARVSFGHGWVRRGALELFAENVALYRPLLPATGDEEPAEVMARGGMPGLDELRLHHGTVWRWNRAVYDPTDGGHLRIEMRALPAGPSVPDMLANAAFHVGLALGLAPEAERLIAALPFEYAHHNFYRAAQHGLAAELLWPGDGPPSPQPVAADALCRRLLPVARRGLVAAGVDPGEVDRLLDVLDARIDCGRTGAVWQRRSLSALSGRHGRERALAELLERYLEHAESGDPVHRWPLPE